MYNWRSMTPEQHEYVLRLRQVGHRPWHSPPHNPQGDRTRFHVFAACYEHAPVVGHSRERMASFESVLLDSLVPRCSEIHAWCLLPNHYHVLVTTVDVDAVRAGLGRLHGRTSYQWNGEESKRGRKVWFNALEHGIKSDRHFWAALNYIHHNPVHHRYTTRWQDWPFSSAAAYLDRVGVTEAERTWKEYPILDYGRDWDPEDL